MTLHVARPSIETATAVVAASATLLPDGKALLVLDGAGPEVPSAGQLTCAAGAIPWQAVVFPRPDASGWCGLAVLPELPTGDCTLFDATGQASWRLGAGHRIGASARFLATAAQAGGLDLGQVFGVLRQVLDDAIRSGAPEVRALRSFTREFLDTVAERDGFIEVLAEPQTGGLFLQGWAQSLADAPLTWISLDTPLVQPDVTAAFFARPDLLDPARGLCLYGVQVPLADVQDARAAFVEQGGRLLRLDVVGASVTPLTGEAAMAHVAGMLPRLVARAPAVSAFRRICRPRYAGEDTLSGSGLPIAMGLDTVHRAPDGTMLVSGWLLDPDRRVVMVLVKSRGNRYGRISDTWVRLPRPDLIHGFRDDPRFAGRLDAGGSLDGFIARVPPAPGGGVDADVYVELVLDDESCLFLPLRPVDIAATDRLTPVLASLSPTEPQLARIIEAHLVPFIASLQLDEPGAQTDQQVHVRARSKPSARVPPLPLGVPARGRLAAQQVPALMPVASMDDLQPVMALLAGTPEAVAVDLHLIAPRMLAEAALADLQSAFRFYGLSGKLVLAPDRAARTVLLDVGMSATDEGAGDVLVWLPRALPKAPGWLARLRDEARAIGNPGALSPALTHEDGSIAFGPPSGTGSVAGFSASVLQRGRPVAVPSPAPDIALLDRAAVVAAGGFAGQLLTEAHAHIDLGARLSEAGFSVWCSGAVEFWRLDTTPLTPPSPEQRILRRIDARLLAHRGLPDPEEVPA